jgi:O-antigen ligase
MELGWGLSTLLVIPLYAAAMIAVLLTLFYRIEIGIFFLIPFLPHQNILNYVFHLPLGKDINDLLIMAMLIRWGIDKMKSNENLLIKTPLNLPIILLIIWTFIEIWWGAVYFGDPIQLNLDNPRLVYWKNWIRLPLLYLIIVNNIKNTDHKKLILLLMVIAVLMLDRSFYNIAMWRDFSHYSPEQRVGGMAQGLGGNELAVCLAMNLAIMLSVFSCSSSFSIKLFLAGPIFVTTYCILFLFSRSGYVAAVAGCCVIGFLKDRKVLVFLIILIFTWESILPTAVTERIEMTKNEETYDSTVQQRFGMWEMGMDIVLSNPILGAGINAARYINITLEEFGSKTWHSFHNAYLQQAVETGLVGLVLYLWIYFMMILCGWRLFRNSDEWLHKALGLGLMACVMACLAGNVAGGYWNYIGVVSYMYILAGLVVEDLMKLRKDKSPNSSLHSISEQKVKPRFSVRVYENQN